MNRIACTLALSLTLAACTGAEAPAPSSATPTPPAAAREYAVEPWTLPVTAGAQPDLRAAPDGTLLLSWIEKAGDGHALRFARTGAAGWSAPRTIAEGDDWFVNWADTPHIAATADGALWAHWLRKSAAATYAYDVVLSRSGDGGANWSTPVRVNEDGTPTEHGFVSLWPAAHDRLGIAWLDGRETAGGHGHGAHGGGAMTLRTTVFDAALTRHGETRLDASTCDCCQTDAVVTPAGALLVYRDRTADEIRDIVTTRADGDRWTPARPVHADRWRMPACPVNGPSASAHGREVAVGWYTMADEVARVQLARSVDAGDAFAAPVEVDRGPAVLGRVSVAHLDGQAWIAWMREDAGRQSLWLAQLSRDGRQIARRMRVAELSGRGRGTGTPQLAVEAGGLRLVWTELVDAAPQLRGARIVMR